jgi:16S rRNA processing protein RimM
MTHPTPSKPVPEPVPESVAGRSPQRMVILGKTRSAVGLAGWLKVESYTEPAANVFRYRTWQLRTVNGWRAVKLTGSRGSGQNLQVQLEGIADRDAAELMRNLDIGVFRHELPPPAAGEYYWDDLLGLTGYTATGECLGQLDHFLDSPAHPFMVFVGKGQDGARGEHLVPLIKGRILEADFAQGRMRLEWTLDWAD